MLLAFTLFAVVCRVCSVGFRIGVDTAEVGARFYIAFGINDGMYLNISSRLCQLTLKMVQGAIAFGEISSEPLHI